MKRTEGAPAAVANSVAGRGLSARPEPMRESPTAFANPIVSFPCGADGDEPEAVKDLLEESYCSVATQIVLLDEHGVVLAISEPWRRPRGSQEHSDFPVGVGSSYLDMGRQLFPSLDEDVVRRSLGGVIAGRLPSFAATYAIGAPDGLSWRQMRLSRFNDGGVAQFIAIHEDVTEATRAQVELCATSEQLLSIQEDERHRIAIELHDSTSQHLVAVGLGVARLRRSIVGSSAPTGILDDMAESLGEAVREIRVLSYLMNPPSLGRDGLQAAVTHFARGFGARTGLRMSVRTEGVLECLDACLQHTAFRIVQEALANVYRHAAATGVDIELANRGGRLFLRIRDDGRGIGAQEAVELDGVVQLGVGIPGMRARVAQFGGALKIDGDAAGTVVSASIPVTSPWARPQAAKSKRRAEHPGSGPIKLAAKSRA